MRLIGSRPGEPSLLHRVLQNCLSLNEEEQRCHRAVVELLAGLAPARSLLDVGCWDGKATREYAAALHCPDDGIVGIECDREQCAEAGRSFRTCEADVEEEPLPVADAGFDVVVCNQVLEHTKNIFFLMGECERAAKTGGHLVFGIPNLAGLFNRLGLALGLQPMAVEFPGPHVRGITHRAFSAFVAANPAVRLVKAVGSTLYPLPQPLMEKVGRRLPGWSSYAFYLIQKKESRPRSYWMEMGARNTQTRYKR